MTKEEYDNFRLRYKGCGACFPIYSELSRFEKMWFTAIQKDVTELTEQNTSLLTSVENLNKSVQELEQENAELRLLKDVYKVSSSLVSDIAVDKQNQLTKAKELLERLLITSCNSDVLNLLPNCSEVLKVRVEAEQFLNSEVEK